MIRIGALAAVLAAFAGAAAAQEVGGVYAVEGTNFDGSRYTGRATIDASSNSTCRIRWETGSTSEGICMLNQNAFAAAYAFENGRVGLVVYELMRDGSLHGIWTIADANGAGTEVLTPLR